MTELEAWFDVYVDARENAGLRPNTLTAYRHSFKHFVTWLSDTKPVLLDNPEDIKPSHVVRFLGSRRKSGIADASVLKLYVDVRVFFNWLVARSYLETSPVLKEDRPRFELKPVPVVPSHDTEALLALTWKSEFFTLRNRAMILLLVDVGVRCGELVGMRVTDVDTRANDIEVTGKGGRARRVPISDTVGPTLRRYMRARERFIQRRPQHDHPALWVGMQGPIHEKAVNKMLEQACKRAGVAHINPHAYRHTAAEESLDNDAKEGEVMEIFGWRTRQMLDRYTASGRAKRARRAHQKFSPAARLKLPKGS